jgi:hypothetical protein
LIQLADGLQRLGLVAEVAIHLHQLQAEKEIAREALDQIVQVGDCVLGASFTAIDRA